MRAVGNSIAEKKIKLKHFRSMFIHIYFNNGRSEMWNSFEIEDVGKSSFYCRLVTRDQIHYSLQRKKGPWMSECGEGANENKFSQLECIACTQTFLGRTLSVSE